MKPKRNIYKRLFVLMLITAIVMTSFATYSLFKINDSFLLGVDAGQRCNVEYNNEYIKNGKFIADKMYKLCVYDYPDIKDTQEYLIQLIMESKND